MARWWDPDGTWNFDIVGVSIDPPTVAQGDSVTLTVSVKNVGNEIGTVSVYLGIRTPVGGEPEYSGPRKIFDIAVGQTKTLSWLYTPSAGTGQYRVNFDVYSPPETHMFDTTEFAHSFTVTPGPASDPAASRSSPSSAAVTVEEGASQTFVANLYDADCDLNYAEWYLENEPPSGPGTLVEEDLAPEGCSGSTRWTGTFPSVGTFEVIVVVYDSRNLGDHIGRTSWVVTVTSAGGGQTPQECSKSADGTFLRFSGHDWDIKNVSMGPGPNNFRENNVWCEADGLHLRIISQGGTWTTAEVTSRTRRHFGHYEFKVSGDALDSLPHDRVVLGLFNYPPEEFGANRDGNNEIDIEFSKWGDPNREPGQYVVYPAAPALKGQFRSQRFRFTQSASTTTHRFTWQSNHVTFESRQAGTQIAAYRYDPDDYLDRIPQLALPVHLNLWLYRGPDPNNPVPLSSIVGAETEIVIESFTWQPEAMPTSLRLPLPLPLG